jgi:hypothetical protein
MTIGQLWAAASASAAATIRLARSSEIGGPYFRIGGLDGVVMGVL